MAYLVPSAGHLGFYSQRGGGISEAYETAGDVYVASGHNSWDEDTGRRIGRWEGPMSMWGVASSGWQKATDAEVESFAGKVASLGDLSKVAPSKEEAFSAMGGPQYNPEKYGETRGEASKVEEAHEDKSIEQGPRGGSFYRTATGNKVYIK